MGVARENGAPGLAEYAPGAAAVLTTLGAEGPASGDRMAVAVMDRSAMWVHVSTLHPWAKNAELRRNQATVPKVAASIRRFGFVAPIVIWRAADRMVAGHTRMLAMLALIAEDPSFTAKGAPGPGMVRVVYHDFDSEHDADLYALADNRLQELTTWDEEALAAHLADVSDADRMVAGWNEDEAARLFGDDQHQPEDGKHLGALQQRFGVPPFTVLDARQGYWKARKQAWLGLGLRSELGRGASGLMPLDAGNGGMTDQLVGSKANAIPGGSKFPSDKLGPDGKFARADLHARGLLSQATERKGYGVDYDTSKGENAWGGSGTSIFDPVLTELLVRWFSPSGSTVLDPFAGGSVRGLVTAALGRKYIGLELRAEQVEANREQWREIGGKLVPLAGERPEQPDFTPELTPVERHGDFWLKRDDLFCVAGVRGGKVRSCFTLCQRALSAGKVGVVTAGSRSSPQVNIVAHIAQRLGLQCRVHTPEGVPSPEVAEAVACGAELVQHKAGYNNVIVARAREDAEARGWAEIPFGMECQAAIDATRAQVANLPAEAARLVVPVGSGMSLAGILHGLRDAGRTLPVLGVVVGADPAKRLDEYAPAGWRDMVQLVPAGVDYHEAVAGSVGGVVLDPHYEAKVLRHLQPGDCVWVVGIRATAVPTEGMVLEPEWVTGDSNVTLDKLGDQAADFVFTCPPYADLEVYSDDPADISGMEYPEFLRVYRSIIAKAVARLKQDRFAAIVVGDVRAPDGTYRNFVGDTISAFLDAGAKLYNEAVLLTPIGSLPVRAGRAFQASKKLGKTHQNVLVFCKGDPRKAADAVGMIDFGAEAIEALAASEDE